MASFNTTIYTTASPPATTVTTDGTSGEVDGGYTTTISAPTAISINESRGNTIGYVNAVDNLTAARPTGYGKIEWTANGQPTNAEPYDTVVRVDEVV